MYHAVAQLTLVFKLYHIMDTTHVIMVGFVWLGLVSYVTRTTISHDVQT